MTYEEKKTQFNKFLKLMELLFLLSIMDKEEHWQVANRYHKRLRAL